jgi:hypothetical protein
VIIRAARRSSLNSEAKREKESRKPLKIEGERLF